LRVRTTIRGNQAAGLIIPASQSGQGVIAARQGGILSLAPSQSGRLIIAPSQEARLTIQPHVMILLQPAILTGPTAYPGLDYCNIRWTTDFDAYYRIRWKAAAGHAWTTEDWSGGTSSAPDVLMEDLDPERQDYWAEVQSAGDWEQPATFTDWTPLDPVYFYTLCSGTYGMGAWYAQKYVDGKLSYLVLRWTTTVNMYQAQIDSQTPSLDYGPWGSGNKTHNHGYYDFDFSKAGTYYWRTRNRNRCYTWCNYSAWKWFSVNSRGTIYAQG